MPDNAKMKALADADFKVKSTCIRCKHFRQGNTNTQWGTCKIIKYKHEKHSGGEREASVPTDGWCPGFEIAANRLAELGAHTRFFKE